MIVEMFSSILLFVFYKRIYEDIKYFKNFKNDSKFIYLAHTHLFGTILVTIFTGLFFIGLFYYWFDIIMASLLFFIFTAILYNLNKYNIFYKDIKK